MVGHGCLSTRVGVQPTLAEGHPVGWRGVEPPALLPTSRYPVPPRWGTGQEGVFRFLRLAFSTRLCLVAAVSPFLSCLAFSKALYLSSSFEMTGVRR